MNYPDDYKLTINGKKNERRPLELPKFPFVIKFTETYGAYLVGYWGDEKTIITNLSTGECCSAYSITQLAQMLMNGKIVLKSANIDIL